MVQGISKHIPMPPTEPGAPGMFRCARPGMISELFSAAALKNVAEREVSCPIPVDGPEQYWDFLTEIAAPFVAALSSADAATVARVKADVISAMAARFPNGDIHACARVIVGTK
jgi:ABC-type Fe3+ transport system substrate-binding protein